MKLLLLFALIIPLTMFSSTTKKVDSIQEIENPLPACPDSPNCERVSITLNHDSTTVMNTADQVLRAMNAQTIEWKEESKIIHSVFKIPIFGFLDDMDIAIRKDGSSTVMFIRSASREGYSDLGVNKRRVNKFIRKLNTILSS